MELRRSNTTESGGLWEIGIATGKKRSQMLCLEANGELLLVAGESKAPMAELIEFHDGQFSLDEAMVRQLVDAATTADHRYTPSIHKREIRKHATQARYKSWQKTYLELKTKHPGQPDTWYAMKIAKMDISQGRDSKTISRHMKK